jgi:hypothetical protein
MSDVNGIPDYADPDSTAYRPVPGQERPDPPPVPGDREDRPVALDEFGTTPEEQRRGEPLDDRLARERSDVGDVEPPGGDEEAPAEGELTDLDPGERYDDGRPAVAYPNADSPEEAALREEPEP